MSNNLTISASPHIHTSNSVTRTMVLVLVALVPAFLCSLYFFGLGALIVMLTAIVGCVITEYLIQKFLMNGEPTIYNCSAILTGVLLAFNLPSNLPIWIILIGCVVAIGIGKMAFGGLGCNIFNPALVGRVFLLISFPAQMTSWPLPLVNRGEYIDATTGATVLSQLKMNVITHSDVNITNLFIGNMGGSLGEIGALALIIGFIFLLSFRIITWHIPISIIATVAIFSFCLGINPLIEIFSGRSEERRVGKEC